MFRASLCPSSGDRLYKTASGVSLHVLAAVVWSQDTSWAHCVNAGIRPAFTQCAQLVSWLLFSYWYWELLLKLVDAFKFWLKHIEITRNFAWKPMFLYYYFVCWCYHCFYCYRCYLVPVGAEFMWMYQKYFTLQIFSNLSSVLCIHLLVFCPSPSLLLICPIFLLS